MSLYHWIWLTQQVPNPHQSNALLEVFQKPDRIYTATLEQLWDTQILGREQCFQLVASRSLEPALHIMNRCSELGIRILTIHDALYPERLRNISNPPLLLYIRGRLPLFDDLLCLALVGTRHASPASLRNAENFAYALGQRGICHISGMADGIDSAGHIGALRAGAMSVAVFGCGPDICYPANNRRLMDRLEESGCIISEYAPGTSPSRASFPRRNRIIAGLSTGVLIFAAPRRSGSLITANLALEFGRDVFVIPGSISDPEYTGANELIKDGATPITTPDDILNYYKSSVIFSSQYPARVPQSDYEATQEELRRTQEAQPPIEYRSSEQECSEEVPAEAPSSEPEMTSEQDTPSPEQEIPPVEEAIPVEETAPTEEAISSEEPVSEPEVPVFREVPLDILLKAWKNANTEGMEPAQDNASEVSPTEKMRTKPSVPSDNSETEAIPSLQASASSNDKKLPFPPLAPADATELRIAVYEAVCGGTSIPDLLVSLLNRPIDDILSALADLEIMGYLRSMPGGNMIPNLKS